jgi:hypothetical protein
MLSGLCTFLMGAFNNLRNSLSANVQGPGYRELKSYSALLQNLQAEA